MSYDREHEGNPVKVDKILQRTYNGETPDEIFGTHHRTDQLIEDLMDGSAYVIPDPAVREKCKEQQEQDAFEIELTKYGLR